MTTPPFSGNDFRDQIDSVARNLTGNAFRLKQNDPDAPLKFMDFVAQSENEFMQVQQPMSELEMLNAQAEARIADPQEQLAPFSPDVGQTPASPDSPLVRALTPTRPLIDRDVAERAGRGLPLVGDVTGPVFGAASELTSPLEAALIAASAGLGAPLAGAARGIPAVGRFIAPLLEPVSGGFGRAAAAEAAAGTGAILGSEQAAEALQDAPAPIRTAGTIAGGLAGGGGGFAAPSVAGRGARAVGEAAANVGAAAERAGLPSPVSVARAASDEPTFSGIGSGDHVQRTRADRIKALASGEIPKNFVEDLNIFSDRVYRESDASEALRVIGGGDTQPLSEIFTSNTPELALGQGTNKGVLIEYSTEGLQGRPDFTKPASRISAEQSGTVEILIKNRSMSSLGDNVISVTIDPNAGAGLEGASKRSFDIEMRTLMRSLAEPDELGIGDQGGRLRGRFDREVLPDGKIRFTPKQVVEEVIPPAPQQAIQPPVARQADDVPPRLPQQAVQPQVADDAALRTIEEAQVSRSQPENMEQVAVRRAAVDEVHQRGVANPESISQNVAEVAHIEKGADDIGGTPPRRPRGPQEPPPIDPSEPLREARAQKLPNERIDERLLNRHQGAINVARLDARRAVDEGNRLLQRSGWGVRRANTLAPSTPDDIARADALRTALHGEGEVPQGMEEIFELARQQTDFESAARIDFDPEMATVDNYFDRGWKPPEEIARAQLDTKGRLVIPPGFRLPRVGASYKEMRDAGFEPLFWNAFEQINYSRMRGVRYRQQMELVASLKALGSEVIQPWTGAESGIPAGWRIPKVGPAFEGKPFAASDAITGEPTVGNTRRYIVPDKIANKLENLYGKRPSMGTVHVGGKDVELMKAVDWAVFTPKRAKLIGSFFQDVDFLVRLGVGSWTKAVDDLIAGKPVKSVQSLLQYPPDVIDVLKARVLPGKRKALRDVALNDTTPIIEGRPGVNMREIMKANLNLQDRTILPNNLDEIVREAADEAGVLGVKSIARGIGDFERAFRNSLFEGTYPAAILNDVRHNIAHVLARSYPDLTDTQLVARIAEQANIKYSTIPETMSVVQNRFLRESLVRLFFSLGESEGLLRQATRAFKGPNKKFWTKHWIGAYLFLISTANIIHFMTTGETLPKERYSPISKTNWGPLPIGYNTQFAAPEIPGVVREGLAGTIDLVGQMDTVFRVLNPKQFTEARFSVPVRSAINQWSGTDFFGEPIDDVGPGGIVSRTIQLARDLFEPIGAGKLLTRGAQEFVPGAAEVLPAGDTQLNTLGLGIEATGVNLRGRPRTDLVDRAAQEQFGKTINEINQLERFRLENDPEIGPVLAEIDAEGAERGQVIPRYRNRRGLLHSRELAVSQEALNDMVVDLVLASREGKNNAWSATDNLSERVSKAKAETAARLDEFRTENGIEGYTGEPSTNEFDVMLEGWYDLIDKHTDKHQVKDRQGNIVEVTGELDFNKWGPASDAFIEALSPELQQGLAEWRSRKESIPGVQEIIDLRKPDPKWGTRSDGSPKSPSGEQMWAEINRILGEIGVTSEQVQQLIEANR